MKFISTLIIFLVLASQLYAQNVHCGTNIQTVIVLNKIIFIPQNMQNYNPNEKIQFCKDCVNNYYLEGLKLSEKLFLQLHLRQRDIIECKTYYSYDYKNNDTSKCIQSLNLFISLKISIKLNGIELKPDEKETALKKIHKDQLYTIKSKRNFFGRATIEITTP